MKHREGMKNFLTTDIYGINGEAFSGGRSNIEVVRQMLEAGIRVIQYREKDKSGREMFTECSAIRDLTRQAGATFIVNDRVDLAIAVSADGVHIGQDDLPPLVVRKMIGEEMILGLSTNLPEQAREAVHLGVVDYIGVGPVYATGTKADAAQTAGLEYVEYVAKNIALPFVPIGGIKETNIAEVRRSGAHIFAIISDIVGAPDIPAKVRDIRSELARA